jgi:hypothetical protein
MGPKSGDFVGFALIFPENTGAIPAPQRQELSPYSRRP